MNLFEAIYNRKSVRKYSKKSVSNEHFDKIENIIINKKTLYPNIGLDIHIVKEGKKIQDISSGMLGSYGKVNGTHYLVITSEEKEGYFENIGYTLEYVILNLTSLGIGTCWIGCPFDKALVKDIIKIKENHIPVLLISFGYAENEKDLYRNNRLKAKRKAICDIILNTSTENWTNIIDAARVAPSAVNLQPWRFYVNKSSLNLYRNKPNFLTKKFMEDFNKIDLGICLCHVEVACAHFNKKIKICKESNVTMKDCYYFTSVVEL